MINHILLSKLINSKMSVRITKNVIYPPSFGIQRTQSLFIHRYGMKLVIFRSNHIH